MLKVLDLFSGIGGFSLGLERTGGFETVAFCEIEDYPRNVLAKHWLDVPCFEDVRELTHERLKEVLADTGSLRRDSGGAEQPLQGLGSSGETRSSTRTRQAAKQTIDLICGGYPCQPFSHAGQRRGSEDDRHLWPEVKRLVASIRPRWCLFENVAGHISMGLDEVLSDLESEGYTAQTVVIPACAVDAPHRRDRVWIMAHSEGGGGRNVSKDQREARREINAPSDTSSSFGRDDKPRNREAMADATRKLQHGSGKSRDGCRQPTNSGEDVADDNRNGLHQAGEGIAKAGGDGIVGIARWLPEPPVGRVAHGVPRRVDRLKSLGNAVVPQVVEMLGAAILEAEKSQ